MGGLPWVGEGCFLLASGAGRPQISLKWPILLPLLMDHLLGGQTSNSNLTKDWFNMPLDLLKEQ